MTPQIPLWPFAILVLLIALGVLQLRARSVRPMAPVIAAVAFMVFSIYGVVSSFGINPQSLLAWVLGQIFALVLGAKFFAVRGLMPAQSANRILIPGSWIPLILMLSIFAAKFVVGYVNGAQLALGRSDWFAPVVSFLLGSFSGAFVIRAVSVLRYFRQSQRDTEFISTMK